MMVRDQFSICSIFELVEHFQRFSSTFKETLLSVVHRADLFEVMFRVCVVKVCSRCSDFFVQFKEKHTVQP